ncbi:MAG TPA: R3H domain-containing nucleic acid-binding protein [Solirubrobacteraceae bacterium]|jgi:spoIIIJ-associated protein|nr:R3H domain-containing nucleic acid-binding protein [Solirubrobacteraceae bacterium]
MSDEDRDGQDARDEDARDEEELDPPEALQELLEEIVDALGIEVEVEVEEREGVLSGVIRGDDVGLFIGRRGQTIDAVQHLAQRIVFPAGPGGPRILIDADGYRERRDELLREDADEAADEALRTGRSIVFDPLPSWERRIVHEHLRDNTRVETHSEGDEPDRYVVVSPAER